MNGELSKLAFRANSIAEEIKQIFGGLTIAQLNWKPDGKSWSIGQCLEHLIITNKLEFPAIENALRENYKNPFWSKIPFLSRLFGKAAIYLFKPENSRKVKAPKSFQPSQSRISGSIVGDFTAHQQKLIEIFERSEHLDLRKTKIVAPVGNFITYSLIDAFCVLIVHEQRHLEQAKRLLQAENFPKK